MERMFECRDLWFCSCTCLGVHTTSRCSQQTGLAGACRHRSQRRQCRQLVKAEYAGQAEHAGRWGKQGKQGKQGGREGREAGRASRAGRASSNACGFMIGDGILNWIVNRLYQNTIWAHLECVHLVSDQTFLDVNLVETYEVYSHLHIPNAWEHYFCRAGAVFYSQKL